jgi:parvulin-like peptidyl-prolyl isomerase
MIKIVPGEDREKKKKMAQEIRDRLAHGAEFADLARVYSEDSTQNSGGDWGWIKRGDLNPEMEQIVFGLPKGKVSEIIELNRTFYIMLAEDKKVGVSKPLKEVRPDIERRLLQIERQKEQQVWIERLRKKAYVKIY